MSWSRHLMIPGVLCLLASPAGLRAQAVTETIHLVITGGANAGTYDLSPTKGGCSAGLTGEDSFGVTFSINDPDPKKLESLGIVVPDVKAAAAKTDELEVIASFGPIMHRAAVYTIETRTDVSEKQEGSGTVTVADHGTTATVTFSGQTAAGVKMQGTVECKGVYRNPG